jgi:hypothetical protein
MQVGEAAIGGMAMNGLQQYAAQAAAGQSTALQPGHEPNIVNVNFGLSWKQITAAFAGLALTISGAVGSGALFLPARDSDVQGVKQIIEQMRRDQNESRDALSRLTLAVDNLSGIVDGMKSLSTPRAGNGKTRTLTR